MSMENRIRQAEEILNSRVAVDDRELALVRALLSTPEGGAVAQKLRDVGVAQIWERPADEIERLQREADLALAEWLEANEINWHFTGGIDADEA